MHFLFLVVAGRGVGGVEELASVAAVANVLEKIAANVRALLFLDLDHDCRKEV